MNRTAQRRGGPPPSKTTTTATSTLSSTVTLEEWESLAPLDDLALKSVLAVKNASAHVPLPPKFTPDPDLPPQSPSASRSSTPTSALPKARLLNQPGSRPGTPRLHQLTRNSLVPRQPVQNPQQFYDWLALIDRSVAHSQESHFRAHVADVSVHLDACDRLVEIIDGIESEVDGMMEGWIGVEESGKSLKDACERLLDERDSLLALTDDIEARLEYFQELERATRMLNHPGDSLVLQTDFLYMVERVDISIDYLRAHKHFKEAEIYLLRFQQCLTRAMTLIKMFFVGSLRALSADISRRMQENQVSSTAQTHLLYTRFRSVSHQLAPLLAELERRAKAHPHELSALLSECHAAYFSTRKALLVSRITEQIRGLDPSGSDLVDLTRAGCSYLKELCIEEYDLYREFFSSGEDQLYPYLETLCDYLYDDLRPRILHEPRLTALCEVCTVLQALMLLDVPSSSSQNPSSSSNISDSSDASSSGDDSSEEEDEDEDDSLQHDLQLADEYGNPHTSNAKGGTLGLGKLHISHLLEMVLQDAQTRLFFKAQSVIQSEIRYYVPRKEDLAWPDTLLDVKKKTANVTGNEIKEKENAVGQIFQRIPSLDKQATWYPTLRKTVWVLSQLHDFVKPAIFDDIAREAVSLCRQSLVTAADSIVARSTPQSPSVLDGQLFLVRHLIILKEIARGLDAVMSRDGAEGRPLGIGGGLDGGVTDALSAVLKGTTSLLPGALFASLGMPSQEDTIHEATRGIDEDLKKACEDVINTICLPICTALKSTTSVLPPTAAVPSSSSSSSSSSTPQPPSTSATPSTSSTPQPQDSTSQRDTAFRTLCSGALKASVARVWMYIEDEQAVRVLLGHVKERIEDAYDEFRFESVKAASAAGAAGGSGSGSRLMSGETVRMYLRGVIESGAPGADSDGGQGSSNGSVGLG